MIYYVLDLQTRTIHTVHATLEEARTEAIEMGPEFAVAQERSKTG